MTRMPDEQSFTPAGDRRWIDEGVAGLEWYLNSYRSPDWLWSAGLDATP